MKYSAQEVIQFVEEEDVKFIRLAFCDVNGKQKNISIMPGELRRAFTDGIAFDGSAIDGFGDDFHSDLFLHPDPSTLAILPWRPEHGRVVRMFCTVKKPDGTVFENDTRSILTNAVKYAKDKGYSFAFGSEIEFYLFKLDENGKRTLEPYDDAGYMDIAPDDKGENVRREICLTLEQMGIIPECSHHEEGPGQNEINFRYSDPLTSADNAVTFCSVVKTIAARNGLWADFSPKPFEDNAGSGFHINISVTDGTKKDLMPQMIAGILKHIKEITAFLNPCEESYKRLGLLKAPKYVSWSRENRSQLVRIPASTEKYRRAELRSPDPTADPYLSFALLIYAALDGIENDMQPSAAADIDLLNEGPTVTENFERLPESLEEAAARAAESDFVKAHLPHSLIKACCKRHI